MTRRILATVLFVTALAVAAFFVPAAIAIRDARNDRAVLELQREAAIIASRVPASGPIDVRALDAIVGDDHRLGAYGPDGVLVWGDGPTTPDRFVSTALAGEFAEGRSGSDLVAAVPVRARPGSADLVFRIDAPRSDGLSDGGSALLQLGAVAVLVIAAAAGVAFALARRLNRPIEELRAWAARVDRGVPPPGVTGIGELDELRADLLADRVRIEELLQRERSFSSNASHQLRTPVAAMRVAIETELEAPRSDATIVLHESLGQLDRLESTVTSLLDLARHPDRPMVDVDLLDVLGRRLPGWSALAAPHDRTVVVQGTAVAAVTDPVSVGHIVDVLVDNAVRHGRGEVMVHVTVDGGSPVVDVSDCGTPPMGGAVDITDAETGHGLGLRLAGSLASAIGARLSTVDGPTTIVRVTFAGSAADPAAGVHRALTRR